MRRGTLLVTALVCLAAGPAWAVKEWYDYYNDAVEKLIPAERHEEAITVLLEALRLKPTPGLGERTYGMGFVDYLPYYHLGICYLRTGDIDSAIRMFNTSEEKGAIRRSSAYQQLLTYRNEARTAENQRAARLARNEVDRLIGEARRLRKSGQHSEALVLLAEAQVAASTLDPDTRREVADLQEEIRAEQVARAEADARARRIEEELGEGRRLLEGDRPTDAVVHFDQVLALDPRNRAAADGRQEARRRILARTTREARLQAKLEGIRLFEAGQYRQAIPRLADAAVDGDPEARDYLERSLRIEEGLRQQRERLRRIEGLEREAEALIQGGQFAEAYVQLESLLRLDPDNVRVRERLAFVDARIGEAFISRFLPNRPPALTIFTPSSLDAEIEGDSVAIVGVATDDRAVSRVEFRLGDQVLGEETPAPRLDPLDSARDLRFDREIPLEPGRNAITVTATDSTGLTHAETFQVTRRLRFYETSAFLPSALGSAFGIVALGLGFQQLRRRLAVRRRFNPYIAGAPVMDDDMFFGRQKLLQRILNVLHHNSLVITGERRIGKTTFLYHLKKALERDAGTEYRFFPVLTNLQGVPESGFFHAVMSDVVESLELSEETRGGMRYRQEDEDYDGRDFSHDVRRVIDELKGRTRGHVKLALLIDEVDVLNEYSERINQRLRSIFMKTFSEHLVAIMSGVGIKRTWKSEGSPWYNFFDEVELAGLTRDEAEDLLRSPVDGVFRYEPAAVEAVLEYSQLKPYLVQKFGIHLVNRIIEERRTTVKADDVEAVREDVLFEGRSTGPAPVRVSA